MQKGIFLPESTFSADCLTVFVQPHVQLRESNICMHVKDPVVFVKVWWIMEDGNAKYPACTLGAQVV